MRSSCCFKSLSKYSHEDLKYVLFGFTSYIIQYRYMMSVNVMSRGGEKECDCLRIHTDM